MNMNENLKSMLMKAASLAGTILERPAGDALGVSLIDEVERAKAEWLAAQEYFETVTDPDLVDFAIYNLEAARRRYIYLLKQARAQGVGAEVV